MEFTSKQLSDFREYEKVRLSGRFNMLDPKARQMTGLSYDDYVFTMKHYGDLRDAAAKGAKR